MRYHESIVDLIGDTPLVRLNRISAGLAPLVLAKLESLNPGGSAKDRIALRMVAEAEAVGQLRPGGVIVEPTSGNTGVGLAMVAQARGYRCVFTCPDKVAEEKRALLRGYGAEVVVCPSTVPPEHPDSYRSVAARLATEIPGGYSPNQYANPANPDSHYYGTGPEIWAQTDGRITHLVAGIGTGGTISGIGQYLKEVSGGRVRVVGADPEGSVYSGTGPRPYLVEGVGQPSLPESYDPSVPDEVVAVSDRDSVLYARRLACEEGILAGGSSGMAVAAAVRLARRCKPQDVIVVVVPDSGRGYLSKIFDEGWARRYGFVADPTSARCLGAALETVTDRPAAVVVHPQETVAGALKLMADTSLRHLPVTAAEPPIRLAEVSGTVSEPGLAHLLATGAVVVHDAIGPIVDPPLPHAGAGEVLDDVLGRLRAAGALLVLDGGLLRGVVTAREVAALLRRSQMEDDRP